MISRESSQGEIIHAYYEDTRLIPQSLLTPLRPSRSLHLLTLDPLLEHLLLNLPLPKSLFPPGIAVSPTTPASKPRLLVLLHIPLLLIHSVDLLPLLLGLAVLLIALPFLARAPRTAGATADAHVHARRDGKAKGLADLGEVELVDVEDLLERVRRVGLEVRPVAVLGGLVEEVVLLQELLELNNTPPY